MKRDATLVSYKIRKKTPGGKIGKYTPSGESKNYSLHLVGKPIQTIKKN